MKPSTSRIGEDQLFYCKQRGISAEDAVYDDRQWFLQTGVSTSCRWNLPWKRRSS